MSLAEIRLDPKTKQRIRLRYRKQMRRWAPALVQSKAPPATKGLMVLMTYLWEGRSKGRAPQGSPRSGRQSKCGYGVYALKKV